MNVTKILMLISSGLFTGVVLLVALKCLSWKNMPFKQFRYDFEQTISIADRIQPPLLVSTVIASALFGFNATGMAMVLGFTAAAILLMVLVLSLMILVPLQRRIIQADQKAYTASPEAMRRQWQQGHLGRSGATSVAFTLLVIASAA